MSDRIDEAVHQSALFETKARAVKAEADRDKYRRSRNLWIAVFLGTAIIRTFAFSWTTGHLMGERDRWKASAKEFTSIATQTAAERDRFEQQFLHCKHKESCLSQSPAGRVMRVSVATKTYHATLDDEYVVVNTPTPTREVTLPNPVLWQEHHACTDLLVVADQSGQISGEHPIKIIIPGQSTWYLTTPYNMIAYGVEGEHWVSK